MCNVHLLGRWKERVYERAEYSKDKRGETCIMRLLAESSKVVDSSRAAFLPGATLLPWDEEEKNTRLTKNIKTLRIACRLYGATAY